MAAQCGIRIAGSRLAGCGSRQIDMVVSGTKRRRE
jgi:hypothetical protein